MTSAYDRLVAICADNDLRLYRSVIERGIDGDPPLVSSYLEAYSTESSTDWEVVERSDVDPIETLAERVIQRLAEEHGIAEEDPRAILADAWNYGMLRAVGVTGYGSAYAYRWSPNSDPIIGTAAEVVAQLRKDCVLNARGES